MSFVTNNNFTENSTKIADLLDGTSLVYSKGRFDSWCIYRIHGPEAHAIKDMEIFSRLSKYSNSPLRFTLYKDFLAIFKRVTSNVNYDLVDKITHSSKCYNNAFEVQYIQLFLYAGMVAEENKKNAILKKYIKRLGVHQVLIEGMEPQIAANYSRGKNWRELKLECHVRGFYADTDVTKLSA